MRKLKRRKIIREALEARLLKNERRIQAISEESYKLRLTLEQLNATPVQKPLTKEARETALREHRSENGTVEGAEQAAQAGELPPVLPDEKVIEQKETI